MVATLEGSDKFAISSSGVQTFKLPEYNCPIHGVVNSTVTFYEPGKPNEYYCMNLVAALQSRNH